MESPEKSIEIHVLVIEDDSFLVNLLEKRFTELGIKAFIAFGANEALPILEKEKNIDAILLDIILPDADGLTFLKGLKENPKFKNIPVVIMSNLGQKEDVKKGLDAGADFYLIKAETDTDEIVTVLEKAIKKYK